VAIALQVTREALMLTFACYLARHETVKTCATSVHGRCRVTCCVTQLTDPPVIFSLNVGGEPGTLSHLGIRYAPEQSGCARSSAHTFPPRVPG
jgi:hypothetical protein